MICLPLASSWMTMLVLVSPETGMKLHWVPSLISWASSWRPAKPRDEA
jgi:hypothetical protein